MVFTLEQGIQTPELLQELHQRFPFVPPELLFSYRYDNELVWKGIERDTQYLDLAMKMICESGEVEDVAFKQNVFPNITALVSFTHLFSALNSPQIEVSKAHTGLTPATHTFGVLETVNTDGFSPIARVIARLGALFHDLGKVFIAAKDITFLHQRAGVLLWLIYAKNSVYVEQNINSELIEHIATLIKFHHLSEAMFYWPDAFNPVAVAAFFQPTLFGVLEQLTYADLKSSNGNEEYLPHAQTFFSQVRELTVAV